MLTEPELEKLRADHPQGIVHLVGKHQAWECVFRAPTRGEYKRFRAMNHDPKQVSDANEILARALVIHPSREAFDQLLERFPAIPEAMSNDEDMRDLLGLGTEQHAKL